MLILPLSLLATSTALYIAIIILTVTRPEFLEVVGGNNKLFLATTNGALALTLLTNLLTTGEGPLISCVSMALILLREL